ncbi:MAG: UvrD-helicase domain-containing protein [Parachlamydiales bacterium]|nr:UvrD-helicase domain-containing protein [Candidatus Acheromyda pituitae]
MTQNSHIFAHLNPDQQKAVLATNGRVLILAGAGSGKTSVLSYRIAHLIQNLETPPTAILGLTFTNKAAAEMRERVGKIIGSKQAKQVTLSTFHSFCMQVLRKEIHHLGYTPNFSLYDEKDVRRMTSQLVRHMLEHEGDLPSIEETISKISFAKSRGLSHEEMPKEKDNWHDNFSADLYQRLQTCMRAYNAVDFDSLLSLTVQLFEQFPEVLERYQDRYRYIMIDEYQDTNPIQYRLSKLLSAKHHNLCVVGDDDQSIYGWRGAEIKNILQFESTTIIKLEQNYRSTPTILKAANAVIAHNAERHGKQLWSNADAGDQITLFHAPTDAEEAQSVVQRMIKLRKEKKLAWKDMAILYRSNILSRPVEVTLMNAVWEKDGSWVRGIPYEIFGGTEFYERAEIKDIIAYLKAIDNPMDQEALLRIINVPRRGISDKTLDMLTQLNRSKEIPLWNLLEEIASPLSSEFKNDLSDRALKGIAEFVHVMKQAREKFQGKELHTALSWLIDEIDYRKAITEEVKSEKMRDFKWENVAHCIDALAIYEEEQSSLGLEEESSLSHFLSTTLLDQSQTPERRNENREDKVNVMTFHSAKGLEFAACYLIGLEDHIIPHEKSLMETGLEEERRLMYVAMTRAKKYLTLSMARKRKKMGKEINTNPSRFLFEIPKELLRITSWQTVE